MSEAKSRFKIESGDVEIEYEGPLTEVNQRYEQAFEWIKSVPLKKIEKIKEKKEQRRGGPRKSIYPPKIDELVSEGFFNLPNRKTVAEVMKALENKGLPVTGKREVIINALRRKIRSGVLKGTKVGREWNFWVE